MPTWVRCKLTFFSDGGVLIVQLEQIAALLVGVFGSSD
jgi:hypothetical protein